MVENVSSVIDGSNYNSSKEGLSFINEDISSLMIDEFLQEYHAEERVAAIAPKVLRSITSKDITEGDWNRDKLALETILKD